MATELMDRKAALDRIGALIREVEDATIRGDSRKAAERAKEMQELSERLRSLPRGGAIKR